MFANTVFVLYIVQNLKQKNFLVLPANSPLVGILISIGDVTDIFALKIANFFTFYEQPSSYTHQTKCPKKYQVLMIQVSLL